MNTNEFLFNSLVHFSGHLLYCSKYDINLPEVMLINLTLPAKSLPGSIMHFVVLVFYYCSTGTVISTSKTCIFYHFAPYGVNFIAVLELDRIVLEQFISLFLNLNKPFDHAFRLFRIMMKNYWSTLGIPYKGASESVFGETVGTTFLGTCCFSSVLITG